VPWVAAFPDSGVGGGGGFNLFAKRAALADWELNSPADHAPAARRGGAGRTSALELCWGHLGAALDWNVFN